MDVSTTTTRSGEDMAEESEVADPGEAVLALSKRVETATTAMGERAEFKVAGPEESGWHRQALDTRALLQEVVAPGPWQTTHQAALGARELSEEPTSCGRGREYPQAVEIKSRDQSPLSPAAMHSPGWW